MAKISQFGGYRRKSLNSNRFRKLSKRRSRRPTEVRVPFMITNDMKQKLKKIGYTDAEIYKMRPDIAQSILTVNNK
jgi:hypothetical protein